MFAVKVAVKLQSRQKTSKIGGLGTQIFVGGISHILGHAFLNCTSEHVEYVG